jgi:hypothetical protein
MSIALKNMKILSQALLLSFLAFYALRFCYNLGKLHNVPEALAHSISSLIPFMPIFLILGINLVKKTNKKQSNN